MHCAATMFLQFHISDEMSFCKLKRKHKHYIYLVFELFFNRIFLWANMIASFPSDVRRSIVRNAINKM